MVSAADEVEAARWSHRANQEPGPVCEFDDYAASAPATDRPLHADHVVRFVMVSYNITGGVYPVDGGMTASLGGGGDATPEEQALIEQLMQNLSAATEG